MPEIETVHLRFEVMVKGNQQWLQLLLFAFLGSSISELAKKLVGLIHCKAIFASGHINLQ